MANSKMDSLIEYIDKENKKNKYANYELKEFIFTFFINNQITEEELLDLLAIYKLKVDKEFKDLSQSQKKAYYTSRKYIITLDKKKVIESRCFCKAYYYDLIEAARKSHNHTQKLIEYVAEIDHVPLFFFTMQHIKAENVWKNEKLELVKEYKSLPALENYRVDSLYDLYMLVINYKPNITLSEKFKEEIEKVLNEKFNFDVSKEKNAFYLDMERLFSWLYIKTNTVTDKEIANLSKIGNTIKNRFLILDENIYRHHDFVTFKGNGRSLLKKIDQEKYIKLNQQYYKIYKSIVKKYEKQDLSKFNYSGYLALFYCFQGGKDYE